MLERIWRKENPPTLQWGYKIGTVTMKNSTVVPRKLKTELPYDPEIPFLGIHLEENMI